jgi:MYXO-CTERM domain-containing protein
VAGVNGGFFDGSCGPVGLVRIDDVLLASNPDGRPPRSTLGVGDAGALIERIAPGDAWSAVHQALGGMPQLVRDGVPGVLWSEEQTGESFATSRHPRTAACVTPAGRVLFVTFDGRTAAGLGMSLAQAADYLVELGCDDAMNYDGGGSTTMWIAGQAAGGVVSYPSDDGVADHLGERSVSNGWFVWSAPFDHPPRFTTTPSLDATDGTPWLYDADAVDIDLQPLTFLRNDGPAAMTVDSATGETAWTPGYRDGGTRSVTLEVNDGTNHVEQSFVLSVTVRDRDGDGLPDAWEEEWGTDPDVGDADGDPDADGFDNAAEYEAETDPLDPLDPPPGADGDADADADADAADDGTAPPDGSGDGAGDSAIGGDDADGGCGCRAAGEGGGTTAAWALLLAAGMVVTWRRVRRRGLREADGRRGP